FFLILAYFSPVTLPRPPIRSFFTGLWAAFGFLSYNGYWTLAAAVFGLHLAASVDRKSMKVAMAAFSAGFLLPNLAVFAIARSLGFDLFDSYLKFSRTVIQGGFGQGW